MLGPLAVVWRATDQLADPIERHSAPVEMVDEDGTSFPDRGGFGLDVGEHLGRVDLVMLRDHGGALCDGVCFVLFRRHWLGWY